MTQASDSCGKQSIATNRAELGRSGDSFCQGDTRRRNILPVKRQSAWFSENANAETSGRWQPGLGVLLQPHSGSQGVSALRVIHGRGVQSAFHWLHNLISHHVPLYYQQNSGPFFLDWEGRHVACVSLASCVLPKVPSELEP